LPIVPGYVSFVTGLTLDEFEGAGVPAARKQAAIHSALFVLGFSLVFVGLGASATALGRFLFDALPLLQRLGGVVLIAFGLVLFGLVRLPALQRERRFHLASKPAGKLGSVVTGVAFGAGWTPCIGPVLASILLYAGMEDLMSRGMLLLGAYALGLGIPFFIAAVGVNWFLAGTPWLRRWMLPLQRAAGAFLVLVGVLLLTGDFARLTGFFARYGQLINLELP
ncbi:MAG: cytochrome c biogenesis CcdA family protein, partial [Gemmatimonadota bacterium]